MYTNEIQWFTKQDSPYGKVIHSYRVASFKTNYPIMVLRDDNKPDIPIYNRVTLYDYVSLGKKEGTVNYAIKYSINKLETFETLQEALEFIEALLPTLEPYQPKILKG